MTRAKHIFWVATALFLVTQKAGAQFSMPAVGEDMGLEVPLVLDNDQTPTLSSVANRARTRFDNRILWRQHNAVDTRVSFTGAMTQYNDSWTTNNQNAVSLELTAYYYHTYTKGIHTSLFKFDAVFGMNYIDKSWFKNQDAFKFYYLASWKFSNKGGAASDWAYSLSTDFASQFADGYASRTDKTVWSSFMAPGTFNAGTGVTWTSPKPKLPFIVTLNALSANGLFVTDGRINDERRGKLGIPLPVTPVAGDNKHEYKNRRHKVEGGSSLNIGFNRTFNLGPQKTPVHMRKIMSPGGMTLQYNTTLTSFYGWITQASKHNNDNNVKDLVPTVNWVNSLIFNPLRFLSLEFRHTLIYDRSQVDKVQMQYYLRLGITFRYKNK